MNNKNLFEFKPFSKKQKQVLTWWLDKSPHKDRDGIIADGAIRSGKTLSMSLSFGIWAMERFNSSNFLMCGKTVGSLRRNVVFWWKLMMLSEGFKIKESKTDNLIKVSKGNVTNYFYLFGGKDEASQDLVQGITAAGAFFDEVALMPESFVNQATGRCSVSGSKFWFNCNPEGPNHWFKTNWIDKISESEDGNKNLLFLHFNMDDNLSLAEDVKLRYRRMYSGVFYKRFILGFWCIAEGLVYGMFKETYILDKNKIPKIIRYLVGVDYGHSNATVFLLCGEGEDGKLYILDEFYHSGKESRENLSPKTYAVKFVDFVKNKKIKYLERIYIDPSAKGFIAQLREEGVSNIKTANNDVLEGLQLVSSMMDSDLLRICDNCKHLIDEIHSYAWDEKASDRGEDKPKKEKDHCVDALRYVCMGEKRYWKRKCADAGQ